MMKPVSSSDPSLWLDAYLLQALLATGSGELVSGAPSQLTSPEDVLSLQSALPPELQDWLERRLQSGLFPAGTGASEMLQLLIEYLQNGGGATSRDRGYMGGGGGAPQRVSWGNGGNVSSASPTTERTPVRTVNASLPPGQNLEGLRIQVIGDSLSVGAQSKIQGALNSAGAANVSVDAQSGRSISANGAGNSLSPRQIRQRAEASGANVVVVELGSNHADYARFIPETMNELSRIQPPPLVVWVNTQTQRPQSSAYGQQYFDQNAEINRIIAGEAATRPNVVVADWASIAGGAGINGGDGLHLTAAGNDAMANLVLQTIAQSRASSR